MQTAHTLPGDLILRWDHGDKLPGIAYRHDEHVRIMDGPFAGECGLVRSLLALDPEPLYRVEVDAAHVALEMGESALGAE